MTTIRRIGFVHLMLTLSLAADLMAICSSARAHGIDYGDIRAAFDTQLDQIITAEKAVTAVSNGMSIEDAKEAMRSATKKRVDLVLGGSATDDNKKSS
jgi:hypothetical protein